MSYYEDFVVPYKQSLLEMSHLYTGLKMVKESMEIAHWDILSDDQRVTVKGMIGDLGKNLSLLGELVGVLAMDLIEYEEKTSSTKEEG